jgi:hypothetical protein
MTNFTLQHNIGKIGYFRINYTLLEAFNEIRACMSAHQINDMRLRKKAVHVQLGALPPNYEILKK